MRQFIIILALVCLPLLVFSQDKECGLVNLDKSNQPKSLNDVSIILEHVPFVVEGAVFPSIH